MKIRYTVTFENEIEVVDGLNKEEIIECISQNFYEKDYQIKQSKALEWEKV